MDGLVLFAVLRYLEQFDGLEDCMKEVIKKVLCM